MKGQILIRKRKISPHLKEVPQVHEVAGEHELLRLGDEAVGHEAEVLHQFGRAVHRDVHVQLGPAQQTQQEVIDLRGKETNHTHTHTRTTCGKRNELSYYILHSLT